VRDALVSGIAHWREHPHTRLADLVDRIEQRMLAEAPRPPLRAGKRAADIEAWRALELQRDPLDLARLGAAARCGSPADVGRQVEALAAWRDPRIAHLLLALLADPPYAGVQTRGLLARIVDHIAATRDRRAAQPTRDLAARYRGIVNSGTGGWMVDQLGQLATRLEAVVEAALPAAIAAHCDELERTFGTTPVDAVRAATRETYAALLADVYAAPADDGPRLVLADALQLQNDPRGELIAIQIAHARGHATADTRRRERELLADVDRAAAWAQPLSNAGHCTFERGFPARIALGATAKNHAGDPAWATITAIEGMDRVTHHLAATLCASPHLRSVRMLSTRLLHKLAREPRPWTHVAVRGETPSAAALAALPQLRALELHADGSPPRDRLAATGLVELDLRVSSADELALPPTLERLAVTAHVRAPRLDLATTPRLTTLSLRGAGPVPASLPASLHALHIELYREHLPVIAVPADSALSVVTLHAFGASNAALAALARTELLELRVRSLAPGALAPFRDLRELRLTTAPLEPEALLQLRRLDTLVAHVRGAAMRLAGLPIRSLDWRRVDLDQLADPLPLRHARVSAPPDLAQLERFLERNPDLDTLELDELARTIALPGDVESTLALVGTVERSRVPTLVLNGDGGVMRLARDGDGKLSRLHLASPDTFVAERFAHALLPRLTSLTADGTPSPAVAKLMARTSA
jgi:uncharacterized protein (TIGR02996 family)